MGFFTHAWNSIKSKVKSVGNFHNIAHKAARVWNTGTQILGKSRNFISKAKRVAEVAMLIPGVGEFAAPIAAGLETADFALGQIDKHRKTAEKYGRKGKEIATQVSRKADRYASRADDVWARKDLGAAVKLGTDMDNDGRTSYKQGRKAYRRGREMYSQANQQYQQYGWRGNRQAVVPYRAAPSRAQNRRNQRPAIANRPYYEPIW